MSAPSVFARPQANWAPHWRSETFNLAQRSSPGGAAGRADEEQAAAPNWMMNLRAASSKVRARKAHKARPIATSRRSYLRRVALSAAAMAAGILSPCRRARPLIAAYWRQVVGIARLACLRARALQLALASSPSLTIGALAVGAPEGSAGLSHLLPHFGCRRAMVAINQAACAQSRAA